MASSALALRIGVAAGVFYAPERIHFGLVASSSSGATCAAVSRLVSVVFSLNLRLFAFKLLPFFSLDSAVITFLMNRETTKRYQEFLWRTPMLGWIGLSIASKLFDFVFHRVSTAAVNPIYPAIA